KHFYFLLITWMKMRSIFSAKLLIGNLEEDLGKSTKKGSDKQLLILLTLIQWGTVCFYDFTKLHLTDSLHPQVTHVSSSHSGCSITSDSGSSSLSDIYQVRLEWMLMGGAIANSFDVNGLTPMLLHIVSFCLQKHLIGFKKLFFV
uniref:Uncharacterized protein n=1 Tax=Strix occidentalis caurina TaxID=311401 RepID=A0A8D0FCV9_STROC